MTGSISGTSPMATATANKAAPAQPWSWRVSAVRMNTAGTRMPISRMSSQVTVRSPRSALVGRRGWVIFRVVAARMVRAPVLAITAVADPP